MNTSGKREDPEILALAVEQNRILITCDKDFGDIIFLNRRPHSGVILFRLKRFSATHKKIAILEKLLSENREALLCNFVIATDANIRIVKF